MGGREIWLTLGRAPRDSDSVTGPRASLANSMTSPLKIYKQTVVMPPHRNGTHVETVRGRGEMGSPCLGIRYGVGEGCSLQLGTADSHLLGNCENED